MKSIKSPKGEWVSRSDRKQTALLSALRNQGALRRSERINAVFFPYAELRAVRRVEIEEIQSLSPAVMPSSPVYPVILSKIILSKEIL
jgi:hypothetical protein